MSDSAESYRKLSKLPKNCSRLIFGHVRGRDFTLYDHRVSDSKSELVIRFELYPHDVYVIYLKPILETIIGETIP